MQVSFQHDLCLSYAFQSLLEYLGEHPKHSSLQAGPRLNNLVGFQCASFSSNNRSVEACLNRSRTRQRARLYSSFVLQMMRYVHFAFWNSIRSSVLDMKSRGKRTMFGWHVTMRFLWLKTTRVFHQLTELSYVFVVLHIVGRTHSSM